MLLARLWPFISSLLFVTLEPAWGWLFIISLVSGSLFRAILTPLFHESPNVIQQCATKQQLIIHNYSAIKMSERGKVAIIGRFVHISSNFIFYSSLFFKWPHRLMLGRAVRLGWYAYLFISIFIYYISGSPLALSYDVKSLDKDTPSPFLPFFKNIYFNYLSGYPVCLYDIGEEQLAKARETVRTNLEKLEVTFFELIPNYIFLFFLQQTHSTFRKW